MFLWRSGQAWDLASDTPGQVLTQWTPRFPLLWLVWLLLLFRFYQGERGNGSLYMIYTGVSSVVTLIRSVAYKGRCIGVVRFRLLMTLNFPQSPTRGRSTPWLCFYCGNYIPTFDVTFAIFLKIKICFYCPQHSKFYGYSSGFVMLVLVLLFL